ALLAGEVELGRRPPGDPWRVHLVDRLLGDENAFSRKCEVAGVAAVGPALRDAAAADLRRLRALYGLDGRTVSCALGEDAPSWAELRPLAAAVLAPDEAELRRLLDEHDDWGELVDRLGGHYARNG